MVFDDVFVDSLNILLKVVPTVVINVVLDVVMNVALHVLLFLGGHHLYNNILCVCVCVHQNCVPPLVHFALHSRLLGH